MAIRTILLHLANDPGNAARLAVAVDLARRQGAELRALFAEPAGGMPNAAVGRGFSYAFVSASREAAEEAAQRLAPEFSAACRNAGVTGEWLDEPGEPADLIARFALFADLVVLGRGGGEGGLEGEPFEELPARVPCPVLVVPDGWSAAPVGSRVVVAWKPGLPAARALHGAVPLMREAAEIVVLTVGDEAADGPEAAVRYLARHGIGATARRDYGGAEDAGEAIVGVTREIGADLVVMGSYSRSRIREMLLGGATRHVIGRMTVPILFSH